jgi:hypothetical protein
MNIVGKFEGVNSKEELKRGEAPLKRKLPLPLDKGKGIQGMGLLKLRGEVD